MRNKVDELAMAFPDAQYAMQTQFMRHELGRRSRYSVSERIEDDVVTRFILELSHGYLVELEPLLLAAGAPIWFEHKKLQHAEHSVNLTIFSLRLQLVDPLDGLLHTATANGVDMNRLLLDFLEEVKELTGLNLVAIPPITGGWQI